MRRFIFVVLVIGALALMAYNAHQVSMLKEQVAQLQSEVAALKGEDSAKGSPEVTSDLERLQSHVEKAVEYIGKGDLEGARTELDKSLRIVERIPGNLSGSTKNATGGLRKKLDDVRRSIERLWDQSNGRPRKSGDKEAYEHA